MSTLSNAELRELGKFLEGNGHRKTSSVFLLYNYLKKVHPEYPEKKVLKTKVINSLFKNANKAEKSLQESMYRLGIVMEDFLIKKVIEQERMDRNFLLLKALESRKLDKMFFAKIQALEKNWEKEKEPGARQWYDLFRLKEMEITHQNSHEKPSSDFLISLDSFYLSKKLYWAFNHKLQREDFFINADTSYLNDEIMQLAQLPVFQKIIQIKLFYKTNANWTMDSVESLSEYQEIQKILFDHLSEFSNSERSIVINMLQSAFTKIAKTNPLALRELFQLNCLLVEKKWVIKNGYINPTEFRYIINMAGIAEEFDWAKNFLESHQKYLHADEKKNAIALSKAALAFHQKNFEEALQYLTIPNFSNYEYAVHIRSSLLQCYYELKDYDDLFDNLIKSFTTFLQRDTTLSEYAKTCYLNFVVYTKKIKKFKDNRTPIPTEFIQTLSDEPLTVGKVWLLKKAKELS